MNSRVAKANSLLQKKISEIIAKDINDPRLVGQLVTVAKVDISPDLKYAKVFVSIFGTQEAQTTLDALNSAAGYIRKTLAKKIEFRNLPELHFVKHTGAEYSEKIEGILKNISYSTSAENQDKNS